MLSIVAAVALSASTPSQRTLPLGEVRDAEPVALAQKVLPGEEAGLIKGGYIRRQWIPGQNYFIRFDERAVVHSRELCRRTSRIGSATAPMAANDAPADIPLELSAFQAVDFYASTYPRVATEETCRSVKGWIANTPDQTAPTLEMLSRLTGAMRQAARGGRLSFEVSCVSETIGACRNSRRALATLPLDRLISVRLENTVYRYGPVRNGSQVRMMQPAVDNRWPQAEFSFDYSEPDGKSWIVLIKGVDRLEAVEMRRTTVIRH